MSGLCNLIDTFSKVIINPLLLLLFAGGLLVFVYGIVEFLWGLSQDTEHKEQGKQHMLYGLLGMFVMASAWAIIQLIAHTVGVNLSCTL
jgi:hypothetical protein